MAVTLPRRTKEYVTVDVTDLLNNLVTLTGTTPQYEVVDNTGASMIAWTTAVIQVMKLFCMIDTNVPTLWPAGTYRLYCRFTTAPELPVLGPFEIEISGA